jgi:PAS domain S-box-containing protein
MPSTLGPPAGEMGADRAYERQLREMNAALLISSVHQHELLEQAEKADALVRESEQRFRTLFDLVPVAVYACDAAGVIKQFNPYAAELWGRKPELGDTDKLFCGSFKLFRPDGSFMPHEQSPMAEVVYGRMPEARDAEVLIERPDGSRVTVVVNIRPVKNLGGEIVGAINCFYDVSERKRAEIALKTSEVRYRRLFETAHDGILVLDLLTRRITDVNPFVLDLLDYPRDYFVGKELWEIGVFRDKEANQAAMEELREKGSLRYEDLPLQDRNGRIHPVEIVANVYEEGHQTVIQCKIRDISERKRHEGEREAHLANEQTLRLEADAANRSKDLFLATLSHEVRTPLNAILGWASILRSGKCSEADVQEGMEVIERNCKAQAQLIEDVLDISRIVSGKLQLQMRPCELVETINAAIDVVTPAARAKGLRLEADLNVDASRVSCDQNRMQQVVWNLLSNAVKFTPKGGMVRITLARESSSLRIQVSDEGQGISADFLPFVFDRFRQADSSTRRKLGGLGLGLSIVRQIVEMHGGTVRAESAGEGRGATFTVNLPVHAVCIDEGEGDAAGVIAATPGPIPVRLDGLRVMVVDDEPDARRLLSKVLGEAGATVTAADSVEKALAELPSARPQVLISDIAMPGQDGFDLIRQVRDGGHSARELPAVALTAFAHHDDRQRALLAGFQMHVSKPVDPHDLTAVIASLAGRTG